MPLRCFEIGGEGGWFVPLRGILSLCFDTGLDVELFRGPPEALFTCFLSSPARVPLESAGATIDARLGIVFDPVFFSLGSTAVFSSVAVEAFFDFLNL